MRSFFEEHGGTYTQVGDYLIPNLVLPKEEQVSFGVWGQRHLRYIKKHRIPLYASLCQEGRLYRYLADIDRQAEEMVSRLVKQLAEKENVTEQLKAEDQMEWVRCMNSIRDRAMEVVNRELISC